jgi:hypothetical protein
LPITYHIGGGKALVHLKLAFNWDMVPAYNVVAKIKGSAYPDEWVMRGNHHDAWVNGANDPISGQAAMLEEARALGELLKTGWKPKRSIIYCSWDGEEPGLIGSTEYAEGHDKEIQQKAVVYINSDSNGRGFLGAGGSQALESFIDEVTQGVTDPQTKVSVFDRKKAMQLVNASSTSDKKEIWSARGKSWKHWVLVLISPHSCSIWALPRSILVLAAKTAAASTILFTIPLTITGALKTLILLTALRLPKPRATRYCAWPMPRCYPSILEACRPPSANMPPS